jgi:hypothetical protein
MLAPCGHARDWYVSAKLGKGKAGTKEKPANDLGNIVGNLAAGDRVFIAGGTYTGRGDSGHDLIGVPVEIYGGYDDTFTQRDPWGATPTLFSGDNLSKNWVGDYRLKIDLSKYRKIGKHRVVVDGLIFDNAGRNQYTDDAQRKINRKASPAAGKNPTPESGGLQIKPWKDGDVVVRNCIVMNTAPTDGAFSLWGHENSTVTVENNLAINNTGNGFSLLTQWHPRDGKGQATFTFTRNTSLFNEKHDPFATFGGSALKLEVDCVVNASNNVLAFNDYYAVDNARQAKGVTLNGNVMAADLQGDYLEFATVISAENLEDEAERLDQAEGNTLADNLKPPLPQAWSAAYMSRNVIDRNAAEAEVKVQNTRINALRAMLGLNLQGTDLKADSDVWLPRLQLDDAMKVAASPLASDAGCRKVAAGPAVE